MHVCGGRYRGVLKNFRRFAREFSLGVLPTDGAEPGGVMTLGQKICYNVYEMKYLEGDDEADSNNSGPLGGEGERSEGKQEIPLQRVALQQRATPRIRVIYTKTWR